MRKPLLPLGLLLFPLLAACRNEPAPAPVAPTSAQEQDRQELMRQPGPEWKAGSAKRKLDILLLIDKSRVRKGEAFGYRLEMQNTGREPIAFNDPAPSFTKDGSLCGAGGFKILATPPGGKEFVLPCAPKAEAAVKPSTAPAAVPESGLDLTLAPGEYLLTRAPSRANRFRPLLTTTQFDALGVWRFKAVYDPAGSFSAASNSVTLEVVP